MKNPGRSRNHQFDLLRILFAILVLLSHAPELVDGNRSREILARLTNPEFTFGILGVDGFFLLSGYLIVKSWASSPRPFSFMIKRFLRIAPGYAVATVLATVVVGLIAPGSDHFFRQLGFGFWRSILFVFTPFDPKVFPGNPYPHLNGSLWTILYEFRCYVMVAILGLMGLFRKPMLCLVMTLAFFVRWLNIGFLWHITWSHSGAAYLGDPIDMARFAGIFFLGACFFLFRDKIAFTRVGAVLCVLAILAARFLIPAQVAMATVLFGSYLLFSFGSTRLRALDWMANVPDISYGIYLYGWPVESLLIWRFHSSPWLVFIEATLICICLGWISWILVEGPALSLKRRVRPSPELSARVVQPAVLPF